MPVGLNKSMWTGGVRLFGWKNGHQKHMNTPIGDRSHRGDYHKLVRVDRKHFS